MKVITDSSLKLSQLTEDDQELPSEKKVISLLPNERQKKVILSFRVIAFCKFSHLKLENGHLVNYYRYDLQIWSDDLG